MKKFKKLNVKFKKHESGQALLIFIMLLATALTVVLATSFTALNETKTTKLEEDSTRALAAAQAGIEASIKKSAGTYTLDQLDTSGSLSGFTGSTTVNETGTKTTFVSPLLQKDEQYTFYLATYPAFGSFYTGQLTLAYGATGGSCNNHTLEFTLIYGTSPNYSIARWIGDTGDRVAQAGNQREIGVATSSIVEGTTFICQTAPLNLTSLNARVLVVRSLFGSTKIGFSGNQVLPAQGKLITSEAQGQGGAKKKVELFQSYPQIPVDFFVTSF